MLALVLCVAASLWLDRRSAGGAVANIYVDGVCVLSVDLSELAAPESCIIPNGLGVNVIEMERGRIRVAEADCPDQVCVRSGWLSDSASPIVCLPHKLVIRLEADAKAPANETAPDAVSQ